MSSIPSAVEALFRTALEPILNTEVRMQLSEEGWTLYQNAWERHIQHRTHADNRLEHELVVLRHFFEITTPDNERPFSISELRVGMATCILHDTCFIPRVTEAHIIGAKTPAEAEQLKSKKATQRRDHMIGSARNAKALFAYSGTSLLSDVEVLRCVGLIALHDIWKLGFPWPAASDWLAVCFVEADLLWPVSHPTGPLADLQRDNGPNYQPSTDELRKQAIVNRDTQLVPYRRNFECTAERFRDEKTIIRTRGGARILARYGDAWGFE